VVDNNFVIYLYVIKSSEKKWRYVGITKNIEKRLDEHNSGKNISTKKHSPFYLIHQEKYGDYKAARSREKFLKSGQGRKFLDSIT
jgi:putative endonuclease